MKGFDLFVNKYPPGNDLRKPAAEMLEQFQGKLPTELLDFWQKYGFGNYGGGLLKIIDPTDYVDTLTLWLGEQEDCFPILMTGFGTLFIYRKLSETADDMCLLDIHYRRSGSFSTSFSDFLSVSFPLKTLWNNFCEWTYSKRHLLNMAALQRMRFFSLLRLWRLAEPNPFHISKKEMPLFISTYYLKWERIIPTIQSQVIRGLKPMKLTLMYLNWRTVG